MLENNIPNQEAQENIDTDLISRKQKERMKFYKEVIEQTHKENGK